MQQNANTGNFATPYKFNAKEQDPETGNYYYGARYYNPQTSIWFGVDPLAHLYSRYNPYNFVMGNPISMVDPDGRGSKCETCPDTPEFEEPRNSIFDYTYDKETNTAVMNEITEGGLLNDVPIIESKPNALERGGFWFYHNVWKEGALEGGGWGSRYQGDIGWRENGGKELFFGTFSTILTAGTLGTAPNLTRTMIYIESANMVLTADDISKAFLTERNVTILTELGIDKDNLEKLKTITDATNFLRGLDDLIQMAAKNPNSITNLDKANVLLDEISTFNGILQEIEKEKVK